MQKQRWTDAQRWIDFNANVLRQFPWEVQTDELWTPLELEVKHENYN